MNKRRSLASTVLTQAGGGAVEATTVSSYLAGVVTFQKNGSGSVVAVDHSTKAKQFNKSVQPKIQQRSDMDANSRL